MAHRFPIIAIVLVLALAVLAGGCTKKPPDTTPAQDAPPPVHQPAPEPEEPVKEVVADFPAETVEKQPVVEPSVAEWQDRGVVQTVYFDFDKSELRPDARSTLQQNAQWLRDHASYGIVIGGHCDERGTIEYNIALGERRASAVRDYLASLGIRVDRMRAISYGEEQPADPGSNEAAWARNRRAEFVIVES